MMSNEQNPNRQRVACIDWSLVGKPLQSFAIASLLAASFGVVGCQQLGFRNRDEDFNRMLADQDDWALPNAPQSRVPRPTAKDFAGPSRREGGTMFSNNASGILRKKSAVVDYGPARASLSDDDVTGPVVNTNEQEIDIDGALASLPPPYRDLMKNQLYALQRQASGNLETELANTKAKTAETRSLSDDGDSRPMIKGELLATSQSDNIQSQNASTDKSTNKVSIRMTDTGADRNSAIASNMSAPKMNEPVVSNAVATNPTAVYPLDTPVTTIALASANSPLPTNLPSASLPNSLPPSNAPSTQSPSLSMPMASPTNWRQTLNLAIEQLEKQIKEVPASDENLRLSQEVTLRMLYVSQRRLEDATRKMDSLSNEENEYFQYQMQALYEASNPDAMPVRSRHWSLVMDSQRNATNKLAAVSNLEVKSVAFCTEVERYGSITKFPRYQFQADQELLLYCEIENVAASKVSKEGFESQLQGSYEIIDSQGRKIADQLLPMEPEICQNHRRDYFIVYKIYVPQQIAPGNYQLRLTVEDMKAHKFGQSQLDFQVKK
ncbi:MAG: hypothetical protein NTY15_12555 [Planctomycetota bacterium]|nr:hypothetical protein [Planctomycetota bacterium]